jgi:hypothetical protein
MSSHPTLRTLQLITLAGFLLHWLRDGHSMRSLVVFAFLVSLIAILAWITKHYPGLGKAIGYLLIAAPFIAWMAGMFDSARYEGHGDGTWAYLPRLLYLFLALVSLALGFMMVRVSKDVLEYTEDEQVEMLLKAMNGEKKDSRPSASADSVTGAEHCLMTGRADNER